MKLADDADADDSVRDTAPDPPPDPGKKKKYEEQI